MEAIVRTAAGVFEAPPPRSRSRDRTTGELVYQAAWGAGADEIVGVRLPPGTGIAGSVSRALQAEAVPDCRNDPRFAAQIAAGTGYVPYTMLVGARSSCRTERDRRAVDARPPRRRYGPEDMERPPCSPTRGDGARRRDPGAFTSLGETRLGEKLARRSAGGLAARSAPG